MMNEKSPQITRINTDYKKIKKIWVISVICGLLFLKLLER